MHFLKSLIETLISYNMQDKADDPDAEARVNSVRGLILVCETLTSNVDQSSDIGESVYAYIKVEVMPALFRALDDYAVDNRGDVGSWVREAAMDALERCTFILCKRDAVAVRAAPAAEDESESSDMDANAISTTYQLFDSAIAQDLVAGIAKQAVEKIDKIREIAVRTLQRILYNQEQFVPSIPYRKLLEEIIPNNSDLEWAVSNFSPISFLIIAKPTMIYHISYLMLVLWYIVQLAVLPSALIFLMLSCSPTYFLYSKMVVISEISS